MASLISYFCIGKRRNEIAIESKDIDGGTTKESPSKLKPIKAEDAANNNSSSEPFKVKHHKRRWRSLLTCGICFPGTKSSFDTELSQSTPSANSEFDFAAGFYSKLGFGAPAGLGDGDGNKNEWFKMQTFDLRGKGGGGGDAAGGGGGGGGAGGSGGNGGMTWGQQG